MDEMLIPRSKIVSRLNMIEGQIKGIKKMIIEERDCIDIITQLAAVNSALQSVAGLILKNYASVCINSEDPKEIGEKLANAVSIWLK